MQILVWVEPEHLKHLWIVLSTASLLWGCSATGIHREAGVCSLILPAITIDPGVITLSVLTRMSSRPQAQCLDPVVRAFLEGDSAVFSRSLWDSPTKTDLPVSVEGSKSLNSVVP